MYDGAMLLRQVRLTAHMTQEQLAGLSGLHVRTVRGLETRHIRRPRRRSVELLARALGLDVTSRMGFMQAWGYHDRGPDVPRVDRVHDDGGVETALARARSTLKLVTLSESVRMGQDRRLAWRRTEEVTLALVDGVVGRTVFYGSMADGLEAAAIKLRDLNDCEVISEEVGHDGRWKRFDLSFKRSLTAGESHLFRYTADFIYARQTEIDIPREGMELGGFLAPPASYLLEVQFAPDDVPASYTQVFQPRPDAPLQVVTAPRTCTRTSLHLAVVEPKPGGHGFMWSW